LTSLFRNVGEVDRRPNRKADEASWEKAIEPLGHETAGERGAGLVVRLEEMEREERRLSHEPRRVGGYLVVSASDMDRSLGA
jgi:hypothetical protein